MVIIVILLLITLGIGCAVHGLVKEKLSDEDKR